MQGRPGFFLLAMCAKSNYKGSDMNLLSITIPYPAAIVLSLEDAKYLLEMLSVLPLYEKSGYGDTAEWRQCTKVATLEFIPEYQRVIGLVESAKQ